MNGLMSSMMECGEHPVCRCAIIARIRVRGPGSGAKKLAACTPSHFPFSSLSRGRGFPKADAAPLVHSVARVTCPTAKWILGGYHLVTE